MRRLALGIDMYAAAHQEFPRGGSSLDEIISLVQPTYIDAAPECDLVWSMGAFVWYPEGVVVY